MKRFAMFVSAAGLFVLAACDPAPPAPPVEQPNPPREPVIDECSGADQLPCK